MASNFNTVEGILGSDAVQHILIELGMQDSSPENKEAFLTALGTNVLNRVLLETLKALPESDHPEFEKLYAAQDIPAMQTFIEPRIPDFEQFIRDVAMKEFDATITRMREIDQGM